jgi:hypothetical protein
MLKKPKVFKMTNKINLLNTLNRINPINRTKMIKKLTFLGGGYRDIGGRASGSSKPYRQYDSAPEGHNHAAGTIEPPVPLWDLKPKYCGPYQRFPLL